ncbi:unnamed protein product [Orchesella dallaii]|uniref:C2H2-type domain-containing protein n=1 Tax=Orchesella dallaii TaxID=48710 RepID=A0ABP1QK27_9HEXA
MESALLEHTSSSHVSYLPSQDAHLQYYTAATANNDLISGGKRRILLNSCFACNRTFIAEKEGSLENGGKILQNLCNILQVPFLERFVTESNPLCQKCCEVIEEFFDLQKQIQGLLHKVGELRRLLGRHVVQSYEFTIADRKNYSVKTKLYHVWLQRIHAPNSEPFTENLQNFTPTVDCLNSDNVVASQPQKVVPTVQETDYTLMDISHIISSNVSESNQTGPATLESSIVGNNDGGDSQSCPSPVSVGFQDDGDGNLSEDENAYVMNLNDGIPNKTNNSKSKIPAAPSLVETIEIDFIDPTSKPSGSGDTENSVQLSNFVNVAQRRSEDLPAIQTKTRGRKRGVLATTRRTHPCKFCGKLFPTNFALEMHVRTHTGERPFKCKICGKGCREKGSLRKHEATHDESRYEGEPKFECDVCGKKYHLEKSLYIHLRDHEKGFTRFKTTPKLPNGPPKPPRKRPARREKIYDESGNLIPTPKEPKPPRKKKQPKPLSDKPKRIRRNLVVRKPWGVPQDPQICSHCGKTCKNAFLLEAHIRLHTGERPYKCTKCDRAFPYGANLNRHMKSVHNTAKLEGADPSHICEECGKGFYSQGALYSHRRKNHLGLPPRYKHQDIPVDCEICGKKFNSQHSLSNHKLRHREKKYECSVCGKPFVYPSDAIQHTKRHNPKVRHNEYFKHQCPACPPEALGFTTKNAVRQHWKLAHLDQTLPEVYKKHLQTAPKKSYPKKQKLYTCLVCPAVDGKIPTYTATHSLDKHNKRYHSANSKRRWKPLRKGCGPPMKNVLVKRQYKCFVCPKVDGKRPSYTSSSTLATHKMYYHSGNCNRVWKPRPPRPDDNPDCNTDTEETNSGSSSEENETESSLRPKSRQLQPIRQSIRQTRRTPKKRVTFLLESESEAEDYEIPTAPKISQRPSRNASVRTSIKNSSNPLTSPGTMLKPHTVMNTSEKPNGHSKFTKSYVNRILGGKQVSLILTRIDEQVPIPRNNSNTEIIFAASNSSNTNISLTEQLDPIQITSVMSIASSTVESENGLKIEPLVEDHHLDIPLSCNIVEEDMKCLGTEEVSDTLQHQHQISTSSSSKPQPQRPTPTTSFRSQFPLIIHNPLSKHKTTKSIVIPLTVPTIKQEEDNSS